MSSKCSSEALGHIVMYSREGSKQICRVKTLAQNNCCLPNRSIPFEAEGQVHAGIHRRAEEHQCKQTEQEDERARVAGVCQGSPQADRDKGILCRISDGRLSYHPRARPGIQGAALLDWR